MDFDFDKHSPAEICLEIQRNDELRMVICDNMEAHAGSFVKALGRCLMLADYRNRYILADAFIGYMIDYQPKKWPKLPEEDK